MECEFCGQCCTGVITKVNDTDIKKLQTLNLDLDKVIEPDNFEPELGRHALKQVNGKCIFLTEKHNKAICRIYDNRPKVCKDYPSGNKCFKKRG